MHEDISPEEKLLSIIKGKQNIPFSGAPKPEIKDIKPVLRSPWSKVDDYISAVLKNDFLKNSILDARVLRGFNKCAVIIAALIAGYLILDIILVSPSRKASLLIAGASSSGPLVVVSAEKTMPIETKSYSYYSNRMPGRNIFGASSEPQGDSGSGDTAADNLGLVGMVPGTNPQAIIEDKKDQKTYYLIKGQSVNGITLEAIDENRVTLDYKGKKMTLFL